MPWTGFGGGGWMTPTSWAAPRPRDRRARRCRRANRPRLPFLAPLDGRTGRWRHDDLVVYLPTAAIRRPARPAGRPHPRVAHLRRGRLRSPSDRRSAPGGGARSGRGRPGRRRCRRRWPSRAACRPRTPPGPSRARAAPSSARELAGGRDGAAQGVAGRRGRLGRDPRREPVGQLAPVDGDPDAAQDGDAQAPRRARRRSRRCPRRPRPARAGPSRRSSRSSARTPGPGRAR